MNYIKIQFKNGDICEYKTAYCNPEKDTLKHINSALFLIFSHLDRKIADCNNLEMFYSGLNDRKTINYFGANVLEFKKIDGRTKYSKALKYYSHRFLFEKYK